MVVLVCMVLIFGLYCTSLSFVWKNNLPVQIRSCIEVKVELLETYTLMDKASPQTPLYSLSARYNHSIEKEPKINKI